MVSQTTRTVTTILTCGHEVASTPGTYVTACPAGCQQRRPDHLTRSRRKG